MCQYPASFRFLLNILTDIFARWLPLNCLETRYVAQSAGAKGGNDYWKKLCFFNWWTDPFVKCLFDFEMIFSFNQYCPNMYKLGKISTACRILEQIDCRCSWAPRGLMMFIPCIVIVYEIINMFALNGYQLLMSTTGLCQCRLSRNVIFSTLSIQWTNKSH